MSLEIREMILRTTLNDATGGSTERTQKNSPSGSDTNTEHIIAECIAKVMERLREENER